MRSVLLAALLSLALPAPAAMAQSEPFRVVNRTALPATALHAVRTGRADWGANLLNRGALAPGATFALRPSEGTGCGFDLRLVLLNGQEVVRRNVDICSNRTVPMVASVLAPTAPPGAPLIDKPTGPPAAGAVPPPAGVPNPNARGQTGTGFAVAAGAVITNHHVVERCVRIFVRDAGGRMRPAQIRGNDAERDLALLRVDGQTAPPLAFRANAVRRGEGVVTYGFPLAGLLSSGPTLTTGEVSALTGLGDNPRQFQISAPVQQGNSGGPLLDRQGNVIGVIVSKLNAARIAQRTGDIPQNVNFAVRGTEAMEFLRSHGVTPEQRDSAAGERPVAEVGEQAHPSTVFIRCEQ